MIWQHVKSLNFKLKGQPITRNARVSWMVAMKAKDDRIDIDVDGAPGVTRDDATKVQNHILDLIAWAGSPEGQQELDRVRRDLRARERAAKRRNAGERRST